MPSEASNEPKEVMKVVKLGDENIFIAVVEEEIEEGKEYSVELIIKEVDAGPSGAGDACTAHCGTFSLF